MARSSDDHKHGGLHTRAHQISTFLPDNMGETERPQPQSLDGLDAGDTAESLDIARSEPAGTPDGSENQHRNCSDPCSEQGPRRSSRAQDSCDQRGNPFEEGMTGLRGNVNIAIPEHVPLPGFDHQVDLSSSVYDQDRCTCRTRCRKHFWTANKILKLIGCIFTGIVGVALTCIGGYFISDSVQSGKPIASNIFGICIVAIVAGIISLISSTSLATLICSRKFNHKKRKSRRRIRANAGLHSHRCPLHVPNLPSVYRPCTTPGAQDNGFAILSPNASVWNDASIPTPPPYTNLEPPSYERYHTDHQPPSDHRYQEPPCYQRPQESPSYNENPGNSVYREEWI